MIYLAFDVEGAKAQLTQIFRDRLSAQGSVWNLQNVNIDDVNFNDLAKKIPNQDALVADLKTCLQTAKGNGQTWANNLQPQLTIIPQSVINFASLWDNAIPLILKQLDGSSSDPDISTVTSLFAGLQSKAQEQIAPLQKLLADLKSMRDLVAADAANFSKTHSSFQQIEALDEANIQSIRSKLEKIKLAIDGLNQEIDVDLINAQKDLSIASSAMKYGGKLGDAGKILGLTIGLIFIVMATFEIDALLSAIDQRLADEEAKAELQFEMTLIAIQILALETASSALAHFIAEFDDFIQSLQANIDGWNSMATNLGAIVSQLNAGTPYNQVVSLFDLGKTQGQWDELNNFSQKWQNMEMAPKAYHELVLEGGSE